MSKTPEELADEYIAKTWDGKAKGVPVEFCKKDFLAGYKAAKQEYEARIQELETQLENWQHNAVHGDEGL